MLVLYKLMCFENEFENMFCFLSVYNFPCVPTNIKLYPKVKSGLKFRISGFFLIRKLVEPNVECYVNYTNTPFENISGLDKNK